MNRRPPRSTLSSSSAASDVYKRQVQDLDKDAVDVSIFSGKLELHNLTLKRSALQTLGLPLYVETGRVEELVMDIPWTSLKSQPVSVRICLLYTSPSPRDS
eukprot:TRINITY_DN47794_c0_g1_i1.p1 TRINITY_DN47794_c0_g1~~TRINITY_DN47794_c0_g1_i1.p1  ORF type:complete len:101 (-),score=37.11 TRINITY_DN47794_c0_g1_i1:110-412(-)